MKRSAARRLNASRTGVRETLATWQTMSSSMNDPLG